MANETNDFPIPSFVDSLIRAVAQKGLTAAATALTGYGVIQGNQTAQLVSLGTAAALWLASFAWTWVHERAANRTVKAALNATPPAPPVPVTP